MYVCVCILCVCVYVCVYMYVCLSVCMFVICMCGCVCVTVCAYRALSKSSDFLALSLVTADDTPQRGIPMKIVLGSSCIGPVFMSYFVMHVRL